MYVFWGSTYLAIRLAVEHIPPILMAGLRFSIAGLVLLFVAALIGRSVRVTRGQLLRLGVIGFLLLSFSNAVLSWAELYVPTGLAAVLVSIVPIWFLLIEQFVLPSGDRITRTAIAGVVLGAIGVLVLFWPRVTAAGELGWLQLGASASLIGSSFTWAFGSVLARRWRLRVDPLIASGWQMSLAGLINVTAGVLLGQHHRATWEWNGVGAMLYLVVFGSWVGYSAYVWLLRHVPTSKVATYAYVNPVVAVFLGWIVLGERVDGFLIGGAAVILPAVALVTLSETPPRNGPPVAESG